MHFGLYSYTRRESNDDRRKHTDGLDDGVLDDALFTLLPAPRGNAAGRVPPGALAQLKVHAHPQVFEQRVEHLQHRGTCRQTADGYTGSGPTAGPA